MSKISYRSLLSWVEGNPSIPAVFPDGCLSTMTNPVPLNPETADPLKGEILVRAWLYRDNCPSFLQNFIQREFGKEILELLSKRAADVSLPDEHDVTPGIREYFDRRIADYSDCDGIIPLAIRPDLTEAIALPFQLISPRDRDRKILDRMGRPIPNWENALAILGQFEFDVRILAVLGEWVDRIDGNSFGLPLVLASERRVSRVGEFSPLDLIASGALAGGRFESVEGIEAKRVLARKIGGKFVVVSKERKTEGDTLFLPPNSSLDEACDSISKSVDDWEICQLDPDSAAHKLKGLSLDLRLGTVDTETAKSRLDRYERVLEAADHPIFDEKLLTARLLRGTIANHEGDLSLSDSIFSELLNSEECAANPCFLVEATAGQVVSLVDSGHVAEAEPMARDLLDWIATGNLVGDFEVRARCRMKAHGVLGGQALLHRALVDPSAAPESLENLKMALSAAENLRDNIEIAFDLVQIVLWYALFQSNQTETKFEETIQKLETMSDKDGGRSKNYLRAHRFLGAYRCLLSGKGASSGFESWPLPPKGTSACDWLRATALKYRGALKASHGELAEAASDFGEGLSLMEYPKSPLLRFISATIAAEASLQPADAIEEFRTLGLDLLSSLPEDFCVRFNVSDWRGGLAHRDSSQRRTILRECQKKFRY